MKSKSACLHQLIRETRNLLSFHQNCGIDYPLSEEIRDFLEANPLRSVQSYTAPSPEAPSPLELENQSSTTLEDLQKELENCHHCALHKNSGHIFGEGLHKKEPSLFIILDPPTMEDAEKGQPISGDARALLIKMLKAIKLSLADVYLTNIVKCVVPDGHVARQEEMTTCLSFLMQQIQILQPKIICTMGQYASQTLLKDQKPIFALRGRFQDFNKIPIIATFHPSLLLKHQEMKQGAWHDLQMIEKKLADRSA